MHPRSAALPLATCLALLTADVAQGADVTVCPVGAGTTCDYPTIQQGVLAASAGDRILLVGGNLFEENVTVSKDLTIASDTTVSTIAPTAGFGLTVTGATVDVDQVNFHGQESGAGLYVDSTGNLSITSSALTFHRSTSSGATATVAAGGTLSIDTFYLYEAWTTAASGPGPDGGGIYAAAGATVDLSNGTIANCSAGNAAGILLDGASLTLDDVHFSDNHAADSGGDIKATAGSVIYAVDSTFTSSGASSSYGGSIYAIDSDVYLESCVFSDFWAVGGGGAIEFIDEDDDGVGSELWLYDCILDGVADTDNAFGFGGGIFWRGDHADSLLTVEFSLFSDNETEYGKGGAIFATSYENTGTLTLTGNSFYYNQSDPYSSTNAGGGVHAHGVAALWSTSNWYEQNTGGSSGGGAYVANLDAVLLDGDTYYNNTSFAYDGGSGVDALNIGVLEVYDGNFDANYAQGGGSGLRAETIGELTVDGTIFDSNSGNGYGVALQVKAADTVTITDAQFLSTLGSSASWGAVNVFDSGDVAITDSLFMWGYGYNSGGLWANGIDSLTLRRNVFEENDAHNGPVVSINNTTDASITNNAFLDNTTYSNAGALYVGNGTTAEMAHNLFLGNTSCLGEAVVWVYDTDLEAVNNVLWHAYQGFADIGDKRSEAVACGTNTGLYAEWDTDGASYEIDYNLAVGIGAHFDGDDMGDPVYPGSNNLPDDTDPLFQDYTLYGSWAGSSFLLDMDSPLIDAGHPSRTDDDGELITDPDGSIPDVGLYGGQWSWTEPFEDFDGDTWMAMWDCADRDPLIYPEAPELCDDHDNDCDLLIDEDVDEDVDDDGYSACEGDCAPEDELLYPGADELCDGLIFDCDLSALPVDEVDVDGDLYVGCDTDAPWGSLLGGGDCDEGDATVNPATVWYDDDDGDGYGDPADSLTQCEQPSGYIRDDTDCADDDPDQYPGAVWYRDLDGDGFGNGSSDTVSCTQPSDYVANDLDCYDDTPGSGAELVYPGADEICNGRDDDCAEPFLPDDESDDDGDGYVECAWSAVTWEGDSDVVGGLDCDDDEDTVYPGAEAVCDGIVNDCDDIGLDHDEVDHDGDGHVECNYRPRKWQGDDAVTGGDDCAPLDATTYPGAVELCDGVMNDCDDDALDGSEDDGDGDGVVECSLDADGWDGDPDVWAGDDCEDEDATVFPGAPELCDGVKNDCDAASLSTDETDDDTDGYVECSLDVEAWDGITGGEDCDDEADTVYPGADAACDGIVNDCDADGLTLDEQDLDGDSYVACGYDAGTWAGDDAVTGGLDCEPLEGTVYPGAAELCDGQINDCNTGTLPTAEADEDSDGVVACTLDSGGWDGASGVWAGGDCDDGDATTYPGAAELCDGVKNDCDAASLSTDETDDDTDGYVECDLDVAAWSGITGGGDCDDGAVGVNPGATEVCDASDVDEDCDGLADDADGSATGGTASYPDFDGDGYGNEDATAVDYCDPPADWVTDNTDCDDLDSDAYPGATEEAYDFVDQDCDGEDLCDVDEDGYDSDLCLGEDCDDSDAAVYPEADDAWYDGVDSNCDGANDYDADGDGYSHEDHGGEDCDDADATIFPGAADEPKDDIDQDCDGEDDKGGCSSVPVGPSGLLALLGLLGAVVRRRR